MDVLPMRRIMEDHQCVRVLGVEGAVQGKVSFSGTSPTENKTGERYCSTCFFNLEEHVKEVSKINQERVQMGQRGIVRVPFPSWKGNGWHRHSCLSGALV